MQTPLYVQEIEKQAEEADLTIAQLCRMAGVNNSTFTRWKNGDSTPLQATLDKFKSVLNKILIIKQAQKLPVDNSSVKNFN